ncbi:MAG TPA: glycosyltransferase family 2 protein [Flavobacterium sp.]|nr:glycosyltransferase family 2 protein [Flavobacterium sp.]
MPYFSVIIPLYNKENFVVATLQSVLAQSFTDFELIIINDGSTDGSEEKIKQFDDARIRYFSTENQGASAARNFGIEHATSNYITFIDADDYWYPDFLQQMSRNISRFPEEQVFSAAIEIETPTSIIPAQYSIEKKSDCQIINYFDSSSKTTAICTSCAVFHKSVFEKTGNFDTSIKSGQDTDLWIRIGLHYSVVFCWKILARYVFDAESLSKKKVTISQKLNFSKFKNLENENPKLKGFLDYNRFSLAIRCKLNGDDVNFAQFVNAIDIKKLSAKKKILLRLPVSILRQLIALNLFLARIGVLNSVFKQN